MWLKVALKYIQHLNKYDNRIIRNLATYHLIANHSPYIRLFDYFMNTLIYTFINTQTNKKYKPSRGFRGFRGIWGFRGLGVLGVLGV